jgi:ferritin
MLSEKVCKSLNKQLNRELYSAYLYLAMSAHFAEASLEGMANWMYVQSKEEMTHAMKFFNYIVERNGKIVLGKLDGAEGKWEKPVDAFEAALEHEKYITKNIYELLSLAREEKDYATELMLNWFVAEQAEEEDNVGRVIDMLKMVKDSSEGLFMIDRELGQRQFLNETGEAI